MRRSRTSTVGSLLLLGSGELGKELAISAQRLGVRVIAADSYEGAPAMQVAHVSEVLSLLDGTALEGVIRTHRPDLIVPEVEAVSTRTLQVLEAEGFPVAPTAAAAELALRRDLLRDEAAERLELRTPRYAYASSEAEVEAVCDGLGYPCMVKPLRSSSGKGLSVVAGPSRAERAWAFAQEGGVGDEDRVLVEEVVDFQTEVTLLVVRTAAGETIFAEPIGHRQERGGYRESWSPVELTREQVATMREMSARITERLGGAGVFGVEFFITSETGEVVFSELSLGPHDTGMVTMMSQDLSQFDLHVRAILGLPIPAIRTYGPAASAVILAERSGTVAGYRGLEKALQVETSQLRIFGKQEAHAHRRMGVALASGDSAGEARARALEAASRISVEYA